MALSESAKMARAALRDFVERDVPEEHRAELSRLVAAFIASVVRDERQAATSRVESVRSANRLLDTILGGRVVL